MFRAFTAAIALHYNSFLKELRIETQDPKDYANRFIHYNSFLKELRIETSGNCWKVLVIKDYNSFLKELRIETSLCQAIESCPLRLQFLS